MNKPPFEVSDIIRTAGNGFVEKNLSRLSWQHLRVLRAIERCRTAARWPSGSLYSLRPSGHLTLIVRVEIAIAASVRPTLGINGWRLVRKGYSWFLTFVLSLYCRINYPRWH